jgi:hypothetical protein
LSNYQGAAEQEKDEKFNFHECDCLPKERQSFRFGSGFGNFNMLSKLN